MSLYSNKTLFKFSFSSSFKCSNLYSLHSFISLLIAKLNDWSFDKGGLRHSDAVLSSSIFFSTDRGLRHFTPDFTNQTLHKVMCLLTSLFLHRNLFLPYCLLNNLCLLRYRNCWKIYVNKISV